MGGRKETADAKVEPTEEDKRLVSKLKRFRLIVRNLSFKTTELSLKKSFSRFGTVSDVSIPKKPDGKMRCVIFVSDIHRRITFWVFLYNRGFGFVQMSSQKEVDAVLKGLNGKEIDGREIAVDVAIGKREYNSAVGRDGTSESGPTPAAEGEARAEPSIPSQDAGAEVGSLSDCLNTAYTGRGAGRRRGDKRERR